MFTLASQSNNKQGWGSTHATVLNLLHNPSVWRKLRVGRDVKHGLVAKLVGEHQTELLIARVEVQPVEVVLPQCRRRVLSGERRNVGPDSDLWSGDTRGAEFPPLFKQNLCRSELKHVALARHSRAPWAHETTRGVTSVWDIARARVRVGRVDDNKVDSCVHELLRLAGQRLSDVWAVGNIPA